MSAYIVEDITINRVVTHIAFDRDIDLRRWQEYFKAEGFDLATAEGRERLGQKLHTLNVAAVDQCYNERNDVSMYRFRPVPCSQYQAYQSLRCLLYQCAEVPERPLYQMMSKLSDALAHRIVRSIPQVEAAEWA